jgi:hypothetical protein
MRAVPAAIAVLLLAAAGCSSDPETVLQSDLPQVPGMAPRDTVGLRQEGGRVTGGQFAYTGAIPALGARAQETMARFGSLGWQLSAETVTGSTAVLVYRKDSRTARVEIIRNALQPRMSTAVITVETAAAPGPAPAAPTPATPTPAAPAPAAAPAQAPVSG